MHEDVLKYDGRNEEPPYPTPGEMLDGPEYRTLEWTDETSAYDDHPSVRWGGSCYLRKMKVRVPSQLSDEEAFEWMDQQSPEDLVWLD